MNRPTFTFHSPNDEYLFGLAIPNKSKMATLKSVFWGTFLLHMYLEVELLEYRGCVYSAFTDHVIFSK